MVLIPALNEELSLPAVLLSLPMDRIDHVVVADNGSTDRTVTVARELGATVVSEPRKGYGAACLTGLRHMAEQAEPPGVVVFLDADGSDDPEQLHRLVDPILDGSVDMVLGVRSGEPSAVPAHARMGNSLILFLVRALFGLRFRDLPPFRAIRFDRLTDLAMDDQNWGWTLQMQIRAGRRALRIRQIDVPYRRRTAGDSKISGSLIASVRVGLKMFYTLARERTRSA